MGELEAIRENLKWATCEGVGKKTMIGYLPSELGHLVKNVLRQLRKGDVVTFGDTKYGEVEIYIEQDTIDPILTHPDGKRILWKEELYIRFVGTGGPASPHLLRLFWKNYE